VVDDAAIIRERLARKLGEPPGVRVVGVAADARAGIALVGPERPDITGDPIRVLHVEDDQGDAR
jgi:chemotaxis response regulator CheB